MSRIEQSRISIIVPVYNAEKYLGECLDSIVKQTYENIEVIIVDDGSTDGSADICKKYTDDGRVAYYYQKHAGVSIARNTGLDYATGKYICFVDADDWLELDAMECLQKEDADIVIYNFYRGETKHQEPLTDGQYSKTELYSKMVSYIDGNGNIAYIFHNIWMRLFKRQLLEENHIRFDFNFNNGEDLLFTFEATLKANTISVRCSEYLYHYRQVKNSLTSAYITDYWKLRKKIIAQLIDMFDNDELRKQMPLRIFSWAVSGIENELKYSEGSKDNIRAIVCDPVCDIFKEKLDTLPLSEKNFRYYQQICAGDAEGIWIDYQKHLKQQKKNKIIKTIRKFLPI